MLPFTQMPKCETNVFKPKEVTERARIPKEGPERGLNAASPTCCHAGPRDPAADVQLHPPSPQSSPPPANPSTAWGFHSQRGDTTARPPRGGSPGWATVSHFPQDWASYSRTRCADSSQTCPSSFPPVKMEITNLKAFWFHLIKVKRTYRSQWNLIKRRKEIILMHKALRISKIWAAPHLHQEENVQGTSLLDAARVLYLVLTGKLCNFPSTLS